MVAIQNVWWMLTNRVFGFMEKVKAVAVLVAKDGLFGAVFHYRRGHVEFPGGKINNGETVEAAAIRETKEEIGLDVQNVRPMFTIDHPGDGGTYTCTLCIAEMVDTNQELVSSPEGRAFWATEKQVTGGVFAKTNTALTILWGLGARPGGQ